MMNGFNEINPSDLGFELWLLAKSKEWELLRGLKGSQEIDLNVAPSGDNDPDKGISMAWWLASARQWELLRELKGTQQINLNIVPLTQGPFKGISVAWWLAAGQRWELLKELKGSQEVDLNTVSLADSLTKGTNVAWLLTRHEQWKLLRELRGSQEVDLNVVPLGEGPSKGISVAWLLASYQQYQLLRELRGSQEVDLNVVHLAEGPCKGVSVAWLLARDQQWELLRELRGSQEVDLNLVLLAEGPFKGISVAWWLVRHKQWQLLRELRGSQEVDLNAVPLSENLHKRISVAWLLVHHQRWALLRELKGSQRIDLDVAPLPANLFYKNHSLASILLKKQPDLLLEFIDDNCRINLFKIPEHRVLSKHGMRLIDLACEKNQLELLAKMIGHNDPEKKQHLLLYITKRCNQYLAALKQHLLLNNLDHLVASYLVCEDDSAEGIEQEVLRFLSFFTGSKEESVINRVENLKAKYSLAVAQRYIPQLSVLIEDAAAWHQNEAQIMIQTQQLLSSLFENLDRIVSKSPYYSKANTEKAHIVLNCLARPELYEWLRDNREADFLAPKPMNWQELSIEIQLRLYVDYCLSWDPDNRALRYQCLTGAFLKEQSKYALSGEKRNFSELNIITTVTTDKGKEKVTEGPYEDDSTQNSFSKRKRLSSEKEGKSSQFSEKSVDEQSCFTSSPLSLFWQSENEQALPEGNTSSSLRSRRI